MNEHTITSPAEPADGSIRRPVDGRTRAADVLTAALQQGRAMAIMELALPHLTVRRLRRSTRGEPTHEERLMRHREAVQREQRELEWLVRFHLRG